MRHSGVMLRWFAMILFGGSLGVATVTRAIAAPSYLSKVPAYDWYHGCGPTAAASIIGYYDVHGCDNLFTASGWSNVKLTANVQDQISSPEHNAKYDPEPDDDTLPTPTKTSIADWFRTSVDPLGSGGSYQSNADNALEDYAKYRGYATANSWYESWGAFTWTDLVGEIDAGRPMMFLVDSSGDGGTDHFVPVIGYDDRGDAGKYYGFYTTWSESETIRWEQFRGMNSSYTWGVAYGTYFTIPFTPDNHAPVAVADAYGGGEDAAITIAAAGVLTNDTDAEEDPLTAIQVSNPLHGAVTLNSNGSFTYTPNANYYGPDSFTYKANDGTSDSNTTTVTLTIASVNDLPVAVSDTYTATEDTYFVQYSYAGLLANDGDSDNTDFDASKNDTLSVALVSSPVGGTLALYSSGALTYTPNANWHGMDSFTYKVSDGTGYSNVATVNIDVVSVNDAPIAVNDAFTCDSGEQEVAYSWQGVLINDTDPDDTDNDTEENDALTVVKVSDTSHGTLDLYASGAFTYTSFAGYSGTDSFTYKVFDGTTYSNLATVLLEVLATVVIPGDATHDGKVDSLDAAILADNFGQTTTAGASGGDFNGDGLVNAADASILAANWGYGATEGGDVPEPSSLTLLLALGGLTLLPRVRTCRRRAA